MKFKTNAFFLKILAIVTMVIDHMTLALSSFLSDKIYFLGRGIGRISFPIFAYLIAQGFYKTKNRKKYLFRLFLVGFISEVPFDLLVFNNFFDLSYNNVFWTLSLGLFSLMSYDWVLSYFSDKDIFLRKLLSFIPFIACLFVSHFLKSDYGAFGVALIFLFGQVYFRKDLYFIPGLLIFLHTPLAAFSMPFIVLDDHSMGRKIPKLITYGFYPFHIILGLILRDFFF